MCEIASGCDAEEFLAELDCRRRSAWSATSMRCCNAEPTVCRCSMCLGSWSFRTLDLMVDQRVLIPRPETEWVCQAALDVLKPLAGAPSLRRDLVAVDLGTGSGAIGLSLATELPRGSIEVWLSDISADALDVARANLAGCGIAGSRVHLAQGSWFQALPEALRGTIDLAIANPPYVADDSPEIETQVKDFEPHTALFGGSDGLRDVRVIIGEAKGWLRPGGWLVIEFGSDHGATVEQLCHQAGFQQVAIHQDLAGLDRFVIAQ